MLFACLVSPRLASPRLGSPGLVSPRLVLSCFVPSVLKSKQRDPNPNRNPLIRKHDANV